MRKCSRIPLFLLTILCLSLAASACSSKAKPSAEQPKPMLSVQEMADDMLKQVEQPALNELNADAIQETYHIDPALLEGHAIKLPLMNVKAHELAILQVKDTKDLPAVEKGIKERAEAVQKQFEHYLPDQYEIAEQYKLIVKGPYVLFAISDQADKLAELFEGYFASES
ncbi:DUF4358 domain-containing protein [Gorillibacterium sp. sgz500922]|uniref:DUF4358 domain-containing protein n=1 Tax=Gorillibacterium sp. sgz500922 TaxID=3446694 RepID=UPI003F672B2D